MAIGLGIKRRLIMVNKTLAVVDKEILTVEDIASILHIEPNTIHSEKWKERSKCPLVKHGKRLLAIKEDFWNWFKIRGNY